MLQIDKAIYDTDLVICKNISRFDESERGLLSQNILSQLRNFVEYIAQKIYGNGTDINPNDYENKKSAWEYIKTQGKYNFLYKLHHLLQKSVSHYTLDENSSERLMLKYYEYLLQIKIFLKKNYNIEVLSNIEEFPLNVNNIKYEYYSLISCKIENKTAQANYHNYSDRYYIQKIRPFFIDYNIYYEVTLTIADDRVSKFDRIIAFTKHDILDNYSVKLKIREDNISINGADMPIRIIDDWEVSIRSCEFKNFAKIFGDQPVSHSSKEYSMLMKTLTERKLDFVSWIKLSDNYYNKIKEEVMLNSGTKNFLTTLDKCRKIIINKNPGTNIISYLLYRMNNKVIKSQFCKDSCPGLSNLNLKWGCKPFDEMPFVTSPIGHNPKIYHLLDCINTDGREYEFLARKVKNNTEQEEMLFTPISDIPGINSEEIDELLKKYNSKLYHKHLGTRKLDKSKGHLYIKEYVDNCIFIINEIKKLSGLKISNYTNSVDSWIQQDSHNIDCDQKREVLRKMFSQSRIVTIYGAAGTGKSHLINHISNFFNNKDKIYLANTNPAINNLKRRVTSGNCDFMTITKFLSNRNNHTACDLLIIDECSTVSNSDMKKIIKKAQFKLIVLVGDTFQIESISFGNWFNIIKEFIPNESVVELTVPYRTKNKELLTIWEQVRNLDIAILEPLVRNNYSVYLDNSLMERTANDEIILCLNYDGLYGVNNLNKFLQGNNSNPSFSWGINTYKIGDPVLFNESNRFSPLIYNNMKGKIINIEIIGKNIFFTIELDITINGLDADSYDFELINNPGSVNSIIRFAVNQYPGTDEDDDNSSALVPFQVAYAVSIHKAQGLEYESVKVVITDEVEELISHSIFYTAITRTKDKLKIYWTPETEKKVLNNFKEKKFSRDIALLKAKLNNS